jgi:DNA-directed RNA polymerase delta subunit
MRSSDPNIYQVTAAVLKKAGRPIDFDAVVQAVQKIHPAFSTFEVKEAIWSLLQDHEAELTRNREVRFVGHA